MEALAICGGCKGGMAWKICSEIASKLSNKGWKVSTVDASGIAHCEGCGKCSDGMCVINDGMNDVINSYLSSNALVIVTPVRFSGPSSQTKTLLDRFQPLWYKRDKLPKGKRICLVTVGGSQEPRTEYIEGIIRTFSISMNATYKGCFSVSDTDSGVPIGIEEAVTTVIHTIVE